MPTRSFHRTDRVNAELRREIGALVHAAARENLVPQASVVDVDVSRELDVATVWVTALQPERAQETVKALKGLAKEFRHAIAHSMRMRRVPELRFKYDDSIDKGERIEQLLREDESRDSEEAKSRDSGLGTRDSEEAKGRDSGLGTRDSEES